MFKCEMCGECCKHLNYSNIYADLDRGDGICKFLDGNRCSIYSERPLKCRIDDCYVLFFKEIMSKNEFYAENKKICKELQKQRRR